MNRDWVDKDFYQTLGVGKSSPPEEIKRAYRKLARLYHPDANPGDQTKAEKFKEISEAYSVLSDPERRKEYDDVRRLVESGGYRHFPGAGSGHGGPFGGQVNLEDLLGGMGGFGDLFGRAGRQAGASRGADLTAELRLTFEESLEGVTKSIAVKGPAAVGTVGEPGPGPGHTPRSVRPVQARERPSRTRDSSPSAARVPTARDRGERSRISARAVGGPAHATGPAGCGSKSRPE